MVSSAAVRTTHINTCISKETFLIIPEGSQKTLAGVVEYWLELKGHPMEIGKTWTAPAVSFKDFPGPDKFIMDIPGPCG